SSSKPKSKSICGDSPKPGPVRTILISGTGSVSGRRILPATETSKTLGKEDDFASVKLAPIAVIVPRSVLAYSAKNAYTNSVFIPVIIAQLCYSSYRQLQLDNNYST